MILGARSHSDKGQSWGFDRSCQRTFGKGHRSPLTSTAWPRPYALRSNVTDLSGRRGIYAGMTLVRREQSVAFPIVYHPAAQDEARRLIAEHEGRALRLVESKLNDQLGKGDMVAALHLDQVRRAISNADAGPLVP